MIKKTMNKHIAATISMLMGPVVVFGMVILMNKFADSLDKTPA